MESITDAKEHGWHRGRRATIDVDRVPLLRQQDLCPSAIARDLKIGRARVYRLLTA